MEIKGGSRIQPSQLEQQPAAPSQQAPAGLTKGAKSEAPPAALAPDSMVSTAAPAAVPTEIDSASRTQLQKGLRSAAPKENRRSPARAAQPQAGGLRDSAAARGAFFARHPQAVSSPILEAATFVKPQPNQSWDSLIEAHYTEPLQLPAGGEREGVALDAFRSVSRQIVAIVNESSPPEPPPEQVALPNLRDLGRLAGELGELNAAPRRPSAAASNASKHGATTSSTPRAGALYEPSAADNLRGVALRAYPDLLAQVQEKPEQADTLLRGLMGTIARHNDLATPHLLHSGAIHLPASPAMQAMLQDFNGAEREFMADNPTLRGELDDLSRSAARDFKRLPHHPAPAALSPGELSDQIPQAKQQMTLLRYQRAMEASPTFAPFGMNTAFLAEFSEDPELPARLLGQTVGEQ